MANSTATFGFKHIGYVGSGAPPTYGLSIRAIQSTLASVIGLGDPVIKVSAASPYIQTATTGQFALANAATATTLPLEGVFAGCQYTPKTGGGVVWSPFWPGAASATDAVAYIVDSADAQFLVATLNTAITSSNIGELVNFTTNGGTTNTFTGLSPMVVDQSTMTTAAGTANATVFPFRIVGLYGPSFGNFGTANYPGQFGAVGNGSDPTSNNNWVIVTFNNQINNNIYGS